VHALCSSNSAHDAAGPAQVQAVENMPDRIDGESPVIAFAWEISVANYPVPIAFLPHKLFELCQSPGFAEEKQLFCNSIKYTADNLSKIQECTVGQSDNVEWYNQRMGALTASNFGRVLRFMRNESRKVEGLLKQVQNYAMRGMQSVPKTNIPSLQWGLKCESVAKKAYESLMRNSHSSLVISHSGLCVDADYPFLRASPDGIVTCSCHGESWLIEAKCPWNARNMDPLDAVTSGTIKYMDFNNDELSLIPGEGRGYYEQVQGTMAVTGMTRCDVILWTLCGILVKSVSFDEDFWEKTAKPKLVEFFNKYVVSEILTERAWRGLTLMQECEDEIGSSAAPTVVDSVQSSDNSEVLHDVVAADDDDGDCETLDSSDEMETVQEQVSLAQCLENVDSHSLYESEYIYDGDNAVLFAEFDFGDFEEVITSEIGSSAAPTVVDSVQSSDNSEVLHDVVAADDDDGDCETLDSSKWV